MVEVGEMLSLSLAGDASESSGGRPRRVQLGRGAPARLLELEVDRDAAAAGVFDELLGLVAESV